MTEGAAGPWHDRPQLVVAGLVLLAVLVNAPYLSGGFACDDLLLIHVLEQDPLPFPRWLGVWSHDQLDAFDNLWWTSPDFAGTLWRPLPSLVLEASLAVFGHQAWPLHLLSLLAHGWVAAALYLLVRGLAPGRTGLAVLAAALFLFCEDHSMGVGWIATFTDMLCVAFVMGALLAHRAWLEHRRPGLLAASLLWLLPALASKESAALAPLFAVGMSLLMPTGKADGRLSWKLVPTLLRRPLDWLPQVLLLAGYLLSYRLVGIGGMHNLAYQDPLGDPLAWLQHLVLHLPTFWLGSLTPIPPSVAMFFPEWLPALATLGLAVALAFLWCARGLRTRPLAWWALGLYLLALLPQTATDASERGLYLPFVGAAVLGALFLAQVRDAAAPRGARWGAWALLLGTALPGAVLTIAYPWLYLPSLRAPEQHTLTALPHIQASGADDVLLLTTPGMMDTLYPGGVVDHHLDEPPELYPLSSANAVFSLEKLDGTRFVLRADRPGWLGNYFARLVRTEEQVEEGMEAALPPFTARVIERTAAGDDVLAVRFELAGPSEPLLLYWTPGGYQALELDLLDAGQVLQLTDSADVWASML